MTTPSAHALRQHVELCMQAQTLLGARAWGLLSHYGKLMDGPQAGRYVGGLQAQEQLDIAQRLHRGETLSIHLMHRHKSGNYETSALRLSEGKLLMLFDDRQELA